jgi:hypothetical protein
MSWNILLDHSLLGASSRYTATADGRTYYDGKASGCWQLLVLVVARCGFYLLEFVLFYSVAVKHLPGLHACCMPVLFCHQELAVIDMSDQEPKGRP